MIARLAALLGLVWLSSAAAQTCGTAAPVQVQVLGSGGPELHDRRAASSYLVWIEGKARVLVDIGGGAALRFAESGASVSDLDVILLTRLRAGHTADLPALFEASLFEKRGRPLPLLGPGGNRFMPSTVTFVRALFDGTRGAYRHLGDFLNPLTRSGYTLQPRDVRPSPDKPKAGRKVDGKNVRPFANERLRASVVSLPRGNPPVPGWRDMRRSSFRQPGSSVSCSRCSAGNKRLRICREVIFPYPTPAIRLSSSFCDIARAISSRRPSLRKRARSSR